MRTVSLIFFPVLIFFLFIFVQLSFAQDIPVKWGDIPKADLEMKSFPQDTNASAVILCDYGESYFNDDLDIVYTRHFRGKILTAKGYKIATRSISVYTESKIEKISFIEGATYVLNEQGAIKKTDLNEKDIYEEKIDEKRTRYRFTLPGLEPGCVVEIRYSIKTQNPTLIRDWTFQFDEPVRWSEYRFRHPIYYGFTLMFKGYEPFAIREKTSSKQFFSGIANRVFNESSVTCTNFRFAMENVPALRDEPYTTTIDDYISRVEIQLSGYPTALGIPKQYLTNWNELVEKFLEADWFYKKIETTKQIRKLANEITSACTSPEEKIKAIYDWVRKSIVWTKLERRYADQDVDDVLETKKGNNAEITFLLLSLLKSAGIEGDPILLSTRDNGKIQTTYPIEAQFNYVLARASLGTKKYYLDATDPMRPLELLPLNVLNVKGLAIKKDTVEWVALTSSKFSSVNSLALLRLQEDGSFKGTIEESNGDYSGMHLREGLKDKKDIDFAKERFGTEQIGISIDSVVIENKDSIYLPLKLKAGISSSNYAQLSGSLIYINPHIINRIKENPFKSEKRKYPVDFSHGTVRTTITNISIPEGFEVKENIANRTLIVGSNLIKYTRVTEIDSSMIQVKCRFEIRESEIEPEYYNRLRDLYAQVVAIQSEQIVLAEKKSVVADPSKKSPSNKQSKKDK